MPRTHRRIVLRSRPRGLPRAEDFAIEHVPDPDPPEGWFTTRNTHLGLAPSARIKMGEGSSYDPQTPLGGPIHGQTLGVVSASRHPDFPEGAMVALTAGGWAEASLSDGSGAIRLPDPAPAAPTLWLGALGVSGFTAWAGLFPVGGLRPGDTVAVTAAAGGVGAMAAQIATAVGARAIGVAGGEAKRRHLLEDLRLPAAVDHRAPDRAAALAAAVGEGGVDLFFDNVGGPIRAELLELMAPHGRVAVCGMAAEYNLPGAAPGPSWSVILSRQLTVRGFLMRSHLHLRPAFERDMQGWIEAGAIHAQEDVTEGFERTPEAFIRMLSGRSFGKTIVRI